MTLEELQTHLDNLPYDKNYQNIDVLGVTGYDDSEPSYLKIASLPIDWTNKVVCDLGCFHGYYSIKVKELGCDKVIGLDRAESILETARYITECSGSEVEYQLWEGGQPTPQCDIALILNMLHHCPDQAKTLQNVNCEYAVFEVNQAEIMVVSQYFEILEIQEGRAYSSRPNRVIIYAKKK